MKQFDEDNEICNQCGHMKPSKDWTCHMSCDIIIYPFGHGQWSLLNRLQKSILHPNETIIFRSHFSKCLHKEKLTLLAKLKML